MENFETVKENFFSMFNVEKMINQLKMVDKSEAITKDPNFGDYNRFGCEFILNGVNTGSDYYNAVSFIEDDYSNVNNHRIDFVNQWDTWLFYSPSDIRGLVFDFSKLFKENKIIGYNGLNGRNHGYEIVREFTIDEFLNEYGINRFYSVGHWNVTWKNIGFSWNN